MHKHFGDNPIKPAHFYMQKVLPLVYDESLSYYEVVDKLVHKLNEIGLVTNKLVDNNLAMLIRKQLNAIFMDSIYNEEDEKIILIINPIDELIVNAIYVQSEEKIVFNIVCKSEVCE